MLSTRSAWHGPVLPFCAIHVYSGIICSFYTSFIECVQQSRTSTASRMKWLTSLELINRDSGIRANFRLRSASLVMNPLANPVLQNYYFIRSPGTPCFAPRLRIHSWCIHLHCPGFQDVHWWLQGRTGQVYQCGWWLFALGSFLKYTRCRYSHWGNKSITVEPDLWLYSFELCVRMLLAAMSLSLNRRCHSSLASISRI